MMEISKQIECVYTGTNQKPWGQEAEMRKLGSRVGLQR